MKIKKIIVSSLVLLVIIVSNFGNSISVHAKIASISKIKTVATVNGIAIGETLYNENLSANISNYKSQGVDVTDPEKLKKIKEVTMNNVIINEVIAQEIKKQKVVAPVSEVESKFQELVKEEGGPEKMKAKLTGLKMTEKKLRENISNQLKSRKFFDKNVNLSSVTVTATEIATFYDQNIKGKKDAPVLKDMSEKINQYLIEQKKNQLIQNYVNKLKTSSKIIVF